MPPHHPARSHSISDLHLWGEPKTTQRSFLVSIYDGLWEWMAGSQSYLMWDLWALLESIPIWQDRSKTRKICKKLKKLH